MVTSSIYSEISHSASPLPLDIPDPFFFAPDAKRESVAGHAGTVLIPLLQAGLPRPEARNHHAPRAPLIQRPGLHPDIQSTTEQPHPRQGNPVTQQIAVEGHHQSCAFNHAQKARSSPKTDSRRFVSESPTGQPKNCRYSDDTPTRKPIIVAAHRQESGPPLQSSHAIGQ
jgi:hypothetical protein